MQVAATYAKRRGLCSATQLIEGGRGLDPIYNSCSDYAFLAVYAVGYGKYLSNRRWAIFIECFMGMFLARSCSSPTNWMDTSTVAVLLDDFYGSRLQSIHQGMKKKPLRSRRVLSVTA